MKLLKLSLVLLFAVHSGSLIAKNNNSHFERSDIGEAISLRERQVATDELISLLKDTNYFDFVDSRVHGIPESESTKSFWWSTMWTGVHVQKLNGKVTYTHYNNGSDNAGIHTSPYLESACYAYLLTGDKTHANLARKLIRGLSAWILSSARTTDETPKILSRAFYPHNVYSTDNSRNIFIDYEANRPGVNSDPSDYVHIPDNPYFGDIWIKNKRSIDDIGHMIRAIAHVQDCRDVFDEETRVDLDQLNALYSVWAKDVDSNDFNIPTYDLNAEPYRAKRGDYKTYHLGDYNTYKFAGSDPNCIGKLAVRLLHVDDAQDLKCGKGISFLEKLGSKFLKNDAIEILRSHHVAAVAMAESKSLTLLAQKLKHGLSDRMDRDLKVAKNIKLSPKFNIQDIPTFLIHANNVGVPMTSDEIRFVYERLHTAYLSMRDPAYYNTFHLFDSSVGDGEYPFDPPSVGLYHRALGLMIGSCTSTFRNVDIRPLLDCDRLKKGIIND